MPRKGAAPAAPEETPPPGPTNEKPFQPEQAEEAKPKRGSGRRRGGTAEEPPPPDDKAIEDWTKPAYADDPGEFMFDQMDDADEWYRVLWFGVEGTGKTTNTMLVTKILPDTGRVLMINAEAGAKKSALARHGVDTSRVALFPPKGQQLTFEALERLFYRIQADLEADPSSWGAVIWDSITAIYQKLLDDVIEKDIRKTAEILQRSGKARGGRAGNLTMRDRFETDRDDYAEMSNQVRLLLRKYRSLHCHMMVTALERRDEDGKGTNKTVTIGPAVSPALATDLLGYMDAVVRTQVNEHGVYFGRTQPTDVARGKDRLNVLPVEMVDPTIQRIHAYVSGDLTEDTDRAQRRLPDREIIARRSLADEYGDTDEYGPVVGEVRYDDRGRELQWNGSDWVPTAGEEEKPEPPKRSGRRSAVSSGRTSVSASPSAPAETASSEPESDATEPESAAAEPPKATTGRRRSTATSKPSAEASEEMAASGTDEPPKTSGRRGSAASRANSRARAQVKEETEKTEKGPATKAAAARAKEETKRTTLADIDEPPF